MEVLLRLPQECLACHHQSPGPACRLRQTSCPRSSWTREDISPSRSLPDCCQPEHLAAIGSPVWYSIQKGTRHTLLTRILMLILPSPARSAWSPFLPALPFPGWHRPTPTPRNRGEDVIFLFSKSSCTTPLTQWAWRALDQTQVGVPAHEGQLCPEPPRWARDKARAAFGGQKWLQRWADTTFLQHGGAHRGNRASGYASARTSKTILGASRVHMCLYFCILYYLLYIFKILVSKNGISLELDSNQTTCGSHCSGSLQIFWKVLWLKSPFPCLLHTNSYTINPLTYNITALPRLLNLASTGCPIQNKDTVVQMCRLFKNIK